MSFSVQLTPDYIPVEPGATTPVAVVVINKSDEADRFELEIEGIDPEWTAVPVPVFGVEPRETQTEKIFFKPSRTSESLAGNYPFVVRIRSLVSGESKIVQAILQVKPFNHISMEINPKKGQYSVWRKRNDFSVTIVNLGNTEHNLQLIGSDPEDACAYEFDSEQVTVGPGQQKEVEFLANPTSKSLFAGGHLIGFSVTSRSVDVPGVVSTAQAQIEQRPLITPASLAATVIVAIVIVLWFLMMPKPMVITRFDVSPQVVQKGQQVNISWETSQASHVKVTAGNDVVYDGTLKINTIPYQLNESGDVAFRIEATREGQEKRQDFHLVVKEPPSTPDPEIISLSAKPARIKLGSKFELDYVLNANVASAKLEPTGQELDLTLSRTLIQPDTSGDLVFTLSASNSDKSKTVKKSITVNVFEESDATIIAFTPSSVSVPASVGRVTLSWQVTGAARVELSSDQGITLPPTVDASSDITVPIAAKTVFTLTAYDSKGRKTTQSRTINFVPEAPPVDTTGGGMKTTTGDTTGAATTGNTTTSTTAGGNR